MATINDIETKWATARAQYGYSWDLYMTLKADCGILQLEPVQNADTSSALSPLHTVSGNTSVNNHGKVQTPVVPMSSNLDDWVPEGNIHDDKQVSEVSDDDDAVPLESLRREFGIRPAAPPQNSLSTKSSLRAKLTRYLDNEAEDEDGSVNEVDEENEDDNDYDYDDGFLVPDDDGDDDDSSDESSANGASNDSEGSVEDLQAGPRGRIPATPRSSHLPPTTPSASRVKSKGVTTTQPFNLSSHTRCAACALGGHDAHAGAHACAYAGLKDGEKDPRTGLVFIREEYERNLAGVGQKGSIPGTPKRSVLLSPAAASTTAATPATPGGAGTPRYAFRNKAHRNALTASLLSEYNTRVFGGALPSPPTLPVEWSARLTKTAGMTYTSSQADSNVQGGRVHSARISLSVKVLDSPYKLAQTLLHELCHAAGWIIDHVIRPPHGAVFQKWAREASKIYPTRTVTVCHNYEIQHKYRYACQNLSCGHVYGRHSKSIDTAKVRCGMCAGKGALVLQPIAKADGTPIRQDATPRQQSEYQRFMAAERASVTASMLGAGPAQVMAELARRWNIRKASIAAGALPLFTHHATGPGSVLKAVAAGLLAVDLTHSPDKEVDLVEIDEAEDEDNAVVEQQGAMAGEAGLPVNLTQSFKDALYLGGEDASETG